MIKSRTWMPTVGESVWVQIEQLEGVPATVAWVDGGKAGLAFDAMLHEAVLARINATYAD